MDKRRFAVPEQKNYEYAYNQAYQLACEKLAEIKDIEQQCRKSGAQYQVKESEQSVIIRYLNQSSMITLPDIDVSLADSSGEVTIREKVLILHYFISAKGTPISNNLITFRELPEGKVYLPTFTKRTVNHLVRYFGEEPDLLLETGKELGGYKADYGDTSVTIDAFKYVPVTIVLWQGDEEFTPEGNILFDATVTDYLSTEDIIVLCEIITWKLVRSLRGA
jgi:hypothetical protein